MQAPYHSSPLKQRETARATQRAARSDKPSRHEANGASSATGSPRISTTRTSPHVSPNPPAAACGNDARVFPWAPEKKRGADRGQPLSRIRVAAKHDASRDDSPAARRACGVLQRHRVPRRRAGCHRACAVYRHTPVRARQRQDRARNHPARFQAARHHRRVDYAAIRFAGHLGARLQPGSDVPISTSPRIPVAA